MRRVVFTGDHRTMDRRDEERYGSALAQEVCNNNPATAAFIILIFWVCRAQIIMANKLNVQRPLLGVRPQSMSKNEKEKVPESAVAEVEDLPSPAVRKGTGLRGVRNIMRTVPPFIPSHDIPRGLVYASQVALEFAFMLAVMCVTII